MSIDGQHLFDVTCVIGSVHSGGTVDPYVAAFILIAEHGGPGTYTFPGATGGTISVTVDVNASEPAPEPPRKARLA